MPFSLCYESLIKCDIFMRYLVYHLSAVICGIKAGELIPLRNKNMAAWDKHKLYVSDVLGIQFKELHRDNDSIRLLFYSTELLQSAISKPLARSVLDKAGYPPLSLHCALDKLTGRFCDGFPHEIGLFLGYPPEDVASFIEHKGRSFICCRYWKVYHNKKHALAVFADIDKARRRAFEMISCNTPVKQTVTYLKKVI